MLDQDVDVIVNAWNRNIFPWWLLLPQGVSGAIKRRGGTAPFKELRKYGWIPFGGAVLTSAGTLPFKGIIHVAGINLLWRASERSIRDSVRNAVQLAHKNGFKSIAFPLIGAGSGGFNQEQAKALMLDELSKLDVPLTPQVLPAFAGISVFRWDINIRESTVLGLVGAGGIGLPLNAAITTLAWTQVSLILLIIIGTVVVSEWVSAKVRHAII